MAPYGGADYGVGRWSTGRNRRHPGGWAGRFLGAPAAGGEPDEEPCGGCGIDLRTSSAAARKDRRHRWRDPAADAAGLEARGTARLRNGCAAIAGPGRPTPHL